ncbi:Eco57I restriction-modification methylase domain-containing protein [Rahnella sp. CJA17(1/100)]|uniref:Eco57I restriction-modification methylase domain-containing protein n=1 Tax=Rahnella sp. CJA17(1/100) TaxID=2508951 RepID=UPI001F0EBF89|nr:N-6 DNA methylase [Rahnella sp. CJA17(1/100)]
MNAHSLEMRKELGAYYTPRVLSQIMSDWAIRDNSDRILEPSFGGCGFLESCEQTLIKLGSCNPLSNLFGIDVDIKAFEALKNKFSFNILSEQFILNDFINVEPGSFGAKEYDVVIGNPPYISMHNMSIEQRLSCEKILKKSTYSSKTLGRNASLWGFFLLHALSFLAEKGRVAWVLPSSFLNAYYAKELINIYKKHFDELKIIKINERLFKHEGADEMSVIFLCDGFHKEKKDCKFFSLAFSESVKELGSAVYDSASGENVSYDNYKFSLLEGKNLNSYNDIICRSFSKKITDFADIKIGMVTGYNSFFILSEEQAREKHLDLNLFKPVVSRFSHLRGVKHNLTRHKKNTSQNKKTLLLNVEESALKQRGSFLRKYLSNVTKDERIKNRTFKKRPFWYLPDDGLYPDAFLSYMVHECPKMVLNQGEINCTNSIHRIFFKEKFSYKEKIAYCISLLSTFSQLSAEIEGRSYGSGVLKIEPTAGKNIKILIDKIVINDLYQLSKKIDNLLINNNLHEAADLVDQVLINRKLLNNEELSSLKNGLAKLRTDRYKGVKNYE